MGVVLEILYYIKFAKVDRVIPSCKFLVRNTKLDHSSGFISEMYCPFIT